MIKWQLPIVKNKNTSYDCVPINAVFHCFVCGKSLCKKYEQDTDFYETDANEEQIANFPNNACKICYMSYINIVKAGGVDDTE